MDEDSCGRRFIGALRRLGFDVLTTAEAGRLSHDDEEQLAFAASAGRVIVTGNDGDFSRLQATWAQAEMEHAGIIVLKQRTQSPEAAAEALHRVAPLLEAGALRNGILHI